MNVLGVSGLHESVPFKKVALPGLAARDYRIAQGFDSAAALVTDQGVRAAAAEERFTRDKGTGTFPAHAIRYCLAAAALSPDAVDYVAHGFAYEPFRDLFEQDDFGRRQFAEVYSRQAQLRCLHAHLPGGDWDRKLIQVPHHLAHAASAFYVSGFEEALILVADGMGEVHSMTIAVARGRDITTLAQVPALHSLGLLYGVVTLHLGFEFGLDEYKVMGLAPHGDPRRYFGQFMGLIKLEADGTCTIPVLFANRTLEERETYGGTLRQLAEVLGPPRAPDAALDGNHADVAAGLQAALQAALMHTLRYFKAQTGLRNLCLAGGVALNCTANGVIKRSGLFRDMFVQPAAGDDGSALGAALWVQRLHQPDRRLPRMGLPLWGPDYDADAIGRALDEGRCGPPGAFASFDELAREVARRLADGQIVAWFQGRMEFGPRALGNRSILADPRDARMRDRINQLVKKREEFRPFAPAVTAEAAHRFFELDPADAGLYAHMLVVAPVRAAYRDRLPAVTHVDGSARVQTVSRADHPRFWTLLEEFGKITGMPVLLNTSFNVRGQPIVCTPTEAVATFLAAGLDALAIGDRLLAPGPR